METAVAVSAAQVSIHILSCFQNSNAFVGTSEFGSGPAANVAFAGCAPCTAFVPRSNVFFGATFIASGSNESLLTG